MNEIIEKIKNFDIKELKKLDSIVGEAMFEKCRKVEGQCVTLNEKMMIDCISFFGFEEKVLEGFFAKLVLALSKYENLKKVENCLNGLQDEGLQDLFHATITEMNRRKAKRDKVDVGFWDSEGNYKEDIQPLSEEEQKEIESRRDDD